jgi:hypothetical protein
MELPKSTTMQPQAVDPYAKLRNWLQWVLVAFCFFVTLYRLEMPCNPVHKSLNSIEYAKAEFHGAKVAEDQLKPLPLDPDWCSTKPRDVSSWARATAAQPPFQFPRIIHQTVEDKYNISCEVLECMQVGITNEQAQTADALQRSLQELGRRTAICSEKQPAAQ